MLFNIGFISFILTKYFVTFLVLNHRKVWIKIFQDDFSCWLWPDECVPVSEQSEVSEGPGAGTGQAVAPVSDANLRVLLTPKVIIIIIPIIITLDLTKFTGAWVKGEVTDSLRKEGSEHFISGCQLSAFIDINLNLLLTRPTSLTIQHK